MKTIRFLRMALLGCAALGVLSCSDSSAPMAVNSPASAAPEQSLLSGLLSDVHLLSCRPLPYDSVSQTIGRAGGTIHVGPHTLTIPAGALSAPVTITAVIPSDTVNFIRFGPQGLTFQTPASLTMSYANCGLVNSLLPKQIVYSTDNLQILEILQSLDNIFSKQVVAPLKHFSGYVLAF